MQWVHQTQKGSKCKNIHFTTKIYTLSECFSEHCGDSSALTAVAKQVARALPVHVPVWSDSVATGSDLWRHRKTTLYDNTLCKNKKQIGFIERRDYYDVLLVL